MKQQLLGFLCCFWCFVSLGQSSTPLQALLIIGYEPFGEISQSKIKGMNEIAALLQQHDIVVHQYYHTEATWDNIVAKAKQCHILIYSGHGSWLGQDGKAGGLCLNPSSVSTAKILEELQLQDNALVIFKSVCMGAGSSAGDDDDIGIQEARERVRHYANPFFQIGAAAYYANNYKRGTLKFLSDFLDGVPLQEAYQTSTKLWTTIEFEVPFEYDTTKMFSIASSPGGGTAVRTTYINGVKTVEKIPNPKNYSIAYVGAPVYSIRHLKGTTK